MRSNIANKAPLSIVIDGTEYKLPILRRKFWIEWAAEIDGARAREAVAHLPPMEAAKMLLIYPVEPIMSSELVRRIHSIAGTDRIFRTSALAATPPVPPEVIDQFLEDVDPKQLESTILILAGLVDFAEQQEKAAKDDEGDESEGPPDPLASSTKGSTV